MKLRVFTAFASVLSLGACSAGTAFLGSGNDLFIGTRDAGASANGLPFALPASVLADLEAEGAIKVKVARTFTDWETGVTRLLISDETLTLSPDDLTNSLENIVLTLDGETLTFAASNAPASNGQDDWNSYLNSLGSISGTGAVYSYEGGTNPALSGEFDSEAFFAFGYETDPDEIAALVGNVVYSGLFEGYGQVISPTTGAVVENEVQFGGTIDLTANFDANTIGGDLNGTIGHLADTDFQTSFDVPIEGNGFLGSMDTMTCTDATCISNSDIGGAFYGVDGLETSGILGMNVRVIPVGDSEYRFISSGGFTATQ